MNPGPLRRVTALTVWIARVRAHGAVHRGLKRSHANSTRLMHLQNRTAMPGGDKANDDPPGMASNLDLAATDLGYLPMQTATTFDVEEGIEQRRDAII